MHFILCNSDTVSDIRTRPTFIFPRFFNLNLSTTSFLTIIAIVAHRSVLLRLSCVELRRYPTIRIRNINWVFFFFGLAIDQIGTSYNFSFAYRFSFIARGGNINTRDDTTCSCNSNSRSSSNSGTKQLKRRLKERTNTIARSHDNLFINGKNRIRKKSACKYFSNLRFELESNRLGCVFVILFQRLLFNVCSLFAFNKVKVGQKCH